MSNIPASADGQIKSAPEPITCKKLTSTQRADLAFRYQDWLLTKKVPSGGFRLLYVISQCFNEENPFHCFPSLEYLAARCERSPSTVWSMLPKLEKIGAIEIVWGSRGSGHPNTYRLPAAFLEFYFGPEKGRRPAIKKPRRVGVSHKQENPDTVSKKPRRVGLNHLLATEDSGPTGRAISTERVFPTAARDVTETSVASPPSPVNTTDSAAASIPETKRDSAFAGRLDQSKINQSKIEGPVSVASSFLATRRTPEIGNGHAAGRPANPPQPEKSIMTKKPPRKPEPRSVSFEKLLRCYPKDRIGVDLDNCLDAFDLARSYHSLDELIHDAIEINLAANRGEDVPELVEFLVDHVGIVTSLAA